MSELIKCARRVLWLEFKADPGWRQTYIDNIACLIMDFDKQRAHDFTEYQPLTASMREVLATRIFEHIFKEE